LIGYKTQIECSVKFNCHFPAEFVRGRKKSYANLDINGGLSKLGPFSRLLPGFGDVHGHGRGRGDQPGEHGGHEVTKDAILHVA